MKTVFNILVDFASDYWFGSDAWFTTYVVTYHIAAAVIMSHYTFPKLGVVGIGTTAFQPWGSYVSEQDLEKEKIFSMDIGISRAGPNNNE